MPPGSLLRTEHCTLQEPSGEITFMLALPWTLTCAYICRLTIPFTLHSFKSSGINQPREWCVFLIHHKNAVQASKSSGYYNIGPAGLSRIYQLNGAWRQVCILHVMAHLMKNEWLSVVGCQRNSTILGIRMVLLLSYYFFKIHFCWSIVDLVLC